MSGSAHETPSHVGSFVLLFNRLPHAAVSLLAVGLLVLALNVIANGT